MKSILVNEEEMKFLMEYHSIFFKGEPKKEGEWYKMTFDAPVTMAHVLFGWGQEYQMRRRINGK
jgi:hypothetical protein